MKRNWTSFKFVKWNKLYDTNKTKCDKEKTRQTHNRVSEKMPGLAIISIRDTKTLVYSSKETACYLRNSADLNFSNLEAKGRGCLHVLYLLQLRTENRDFLENCITQDILIRNPKRKVITKFYKLQRKFMV